LQLNDTDFRKMTQRSGCNPLHAMMGPLGFSNCATTQFPMYAGAVYARALDKKWLGKPWKEHLLSQFKPISHVAIDFYRFSQGQVKQIATQAMQKPEYQYARISRVIDNAMSEYVLKLDAAKKNYQQISGFEFRAPISWGLELIEAAKFAPIGGLDVASAFYPINANTILLEDLHIVELKDFFATAIYHFDHFPYVLVQKTLKKWDIDENNSWTVMKLSPDAKLVIDGVYVSLAKFVNQKTVKKYKHLTIVDTKMYIITHFPGKLDASSGTLTLSENPPVTSPRVLK